jgi:hypothetical protein
MDDREQLLYTVEEAGLILRVKPSWLTAKARKREIPCTMIGRTRMFSNANLAEILAIYEVRPAGEPIVPSISERFAAWVDGQEDEPAPEDAFVEGFAQAMEWADGAKRNVLPGLNRGPWSA